MQSNNYNIKEAWEIEQKRVFCKQSCTKISQGLDKLDPRSGERAIWELIQNARDLARTNDLGEKKAHIKITLTPDEFIFAHKGRPFNHDSLTSLVMQVSSQEKETGDAVGQYGTGFLTTHAFGRKLYITGSLSMEPQLPGEFVDIENFEIDRTFDEMPEFVDKVAHQLHNINKYADNPTTPESKEWTKLVYDLSSAEDAYTKAHDAIQASFEVMPYVLTMNKEICDVTIEDKVNNDTYTFEKYELPDEAGLKVMGIRTAHNGMVEERKVYYLQSEDGEDIAILPLESPTKAKSLTGIAKLFVFFPLLGTESFGMDAIFHSKKFIPVGERDGLHLPVSNANVRSKYEQNIAIIEKLSDMVFDYYRENIENIDNMEEVTSLCFECERNKEDITNDYFKSLKSKWVKFYESIPMIDYEEGRAKIEDESVAFFDSQIVRSIEEAGENKDARFAAVFKAANTVKYMPLEEKVMKWSKVVATWNENHPLMIDLDTLAKEISESDTHFEIEDLLAFDHYISEIGMNCLFETYPLLPNRNGDMKKKTELRDASNIPVWLGEIARKIVPAKTDLFIDDRFIKLDSLSMFYRNDLIEAINTKLTELRREKIDKGICYDDSILEVLCQLSYIFSTEEKGTVRCNAMEVIARHLGIQLNSRLLQPLDSQEKQIYKLPFKHLAENMLLHISMQDSSWVEENDDFVLALHTALAPWPEYFNRNNGEGIGTKYRAVPNRLGEVYLVKDMMRGEGITEDLESLYREVIGEDINYQLVDSRYEEFFDFNVKSAKNVAQEIEESLEEEKFENTAVLDIINKLDGNEEWQKLFPRISEKKAELFLKQVHEDCKEDIFKLMKVNDADKLNQLAELADEVDIEKIINEGRAAVMEKKNKEADLMFKTQLGTYVEKMIKSQLEEGLADSKTSSDEISVVPEYYGCDLSICKNGEPVYFIEVKSRWSTDKSVQMTPLQMTKSVNNSDNYTLCCVDMTKCPYVNIDEHTYPTLEETIPYIKVIPNIGDLNRDIAKVAGETASEEVHIGGDYKCVVPQKVISNEGIELPELVALICDRLQ